MAPRKNRATKVVEEGISVSTRDDFSDVTKIELLVRAANLCSRCHVFTIGSTDAGDRKNSIGVAAHICAAASGPGAKRYDPNQTKAQRRHFDNGIWMCYSCSKLIDNEETSYTVSHLKEMKANHQAYVSSLVGVIPMAPFEAENKIRTGIIEATISLITKAGSPASFDVSAVVEGYEQSINSIDPNFKVIVTATSGAVVHELIPITDPSPEIKLIFNDEAEKTANSAWQKMTESGESIHLSTNDFKFVGSNFFEYLNEIAAGGVLTLIPSKRRLDTTIYFVSSEAEFEFSSTESFMGAGSKKFDIEGVALDGFFKYKYLINEFSQVNASYHFEIAAWLGQPIKNLRNFHRIKRAYDFLVKYPDSKVSIQVILDGSPLRLWDGNSDDYAKFFDQLKRLVGIVENAKFISSKVSEPLRLKTIELNLHDELYLQLYSQLFKGKVIKHLSYWESIFADRIDEEKGKAMKFFLSDERLEVTITKSPVIDLFGNRIQLPKMISRVSCFDLVFFSSIRDFDRQSQWCAGIANNRSMSVTSMDSSDLPLLLKNEKK